MPIIYDGQDERFYSPRKLGTGFRKKGLTFNSLYQGGAWRDFGSNVVIGSGERKPEFIAEKKIKDAKQQEALEKIMRNTMTKKGDGFVEDAARSATHAIVDLIPIVGQLIPNSWIDKACDWIGDNIWAPIKNLFTGKGLSEDQIAREREKFIIENEGKIAEIARTLLEEDVKTGSGIIPSYIKKLRGGDKEQMRIADKLVKTITKPEFDKYIRNVPKETTLEDALKLYKGQKSIVPSGTPPVPSEAPRTKEDIIGGGFKRV